MEVDEWHLARQCLAEPHVVDVVRVATPVAVTQEAIGSDLVLVWTGSARHGRRRGDADRHLGKRCGLEDALGTHERDALPLELEALPQRPDRHDIAVPLLELPQVRERSEPNQPIPLSRVHRHHVYPFDDHHRRFGSACVVGDHHEPTFQPAESTIGLAWTGPRPSGDATVR